MTEFSFPSHIVVLRSVADARLGLADHQMTLDPTTNIYVNGLATQFVGSHEVRALRRPRSSLFCSSSSAQIL